MQKGATVQEKYQRYYDHCLSTLASMIPVDVCRVMCAASIVRSRSLDCIVM